jgi:hypothetical protein
MGLYPRIHPWKICSSGPMRGSSVALAVRVRITNYKDQITNKFQIPRLNLPRSKPRGIFAGRIKKEISSSLANPAASGGECARYRGSMTKTFKGGPCLDLGIPVIGNCLIFVICNLIFGISINQ